MQIYLDNHSTTKCDIRVVKEMLPYFSKHYGNSSSLHFLGENAKKAVELSKGRIAQSIGVDKDNIYFCSGATEANNIVLQGRWRNFRSFLDKTKRATIITSPIEHNSILKCLDKIKKRDPNINILATKVNQDGVIDLEYLEKLITDCNDFILAVTIMIANNEIGTINDIKSISKMCNRYGIFFHTDGTQALGKLRLNLSNYDIDAMSISGHKIYGPKGIGAVYISQKFSNKIEPIIDGGYQNTYTSGTQNIPAIVGFGKACELLFEDPDELNRITRLRNNLLNQLLENIPGVRVNGDMKSRLSNNLNINIKNIPSEALILGMSDVIISGGAACKSGSHKASHVLEAIKAKSPECAIRFGLGRWTTQKEIDYAVKRITEVVNDIRSD